MGACLSNNNQPINQNSAELIHSKNLDKQIRQDEKRQTREIKLLLLGAGDSGKSTILRSIRLINQIKFTKQEIEDYRKLIFTENLIKGIRTILDKMEEENIPFENQENVHCIPFLIKRIDLQDGQPFPPDYFDLFCNLWNDENVQKTLHAFGNQSGVPMENLFYYFSNLKRLFEKEYIPTEKDILLCRNKTIGIVETCFSSGTNPEKDQIYRIFDVGGQRSERKKWIHCFENVNGVLFVVAISGYDCCLQEDKSQNQMKESLNLFGSICNSPWFTRTSMILFLNKIDIFQTKIKISPIKNHFQDFQDDDQFDFDQAKSFFKNRFLRLNRSKTKEVYPYFTNATDPNLIKVVMVTVNEIILTNHLRGTLL